MLRILLDENMPRKLTDLLDADDIEAQTIGQCGWKGKQDGELLEAAQDEFDVFITIDQGIPHQQNISRLRIGIILLKAHSNRYADMVPLMGQVNKKIRHITDGKLMTITSQ
jgi:predicted nuclease of predicted toxin-antitoxin system